MEYNFVTKVVLSFIYNIYTILSLAYLKYVMEWYMLSIIKTRIIYDI